MWLWLVKVTRGRRWARGRHGAPISCVVLAGIRSRGILLPPYLRVAIPPSVPPPPLGEVFSCESQTLSPPWHSVRSLPKGASSGTALSYPGSPLAPSEPGLGLCSPSECFRCEPGARTVARTPKAGRFPQPARPSVCSVDLEPRNGTMEPAGFPTKQCLTGQ